MTTHRHARKHRKGLGGRLLYAGCIAAVLVIGMTASAAQARPGTLDPSFGTNGRVLVPKANLAGMASLPDGRIVTAAQANTLDTYANGGPPAALRVYLPNGHLDPRFGDEGIARIAEPEGRYTDVAAIAVDGRGRIVVAGAAIAIPPRYENPLQYPDGVRSYAVIERYLPDGRLDSTFGAAGVLVTDLGFPAPTRPTGIPDYAQPSLPVAVGIEGVAVDSRERIVLTGTRATTYTTTKNGLSEIDEAFAARLGPSGNLDPSFHGAGISQLPNLVSIGKPTVGDNDGVYFTGLSSQGPSRHPLVLANLADDGALAPGFGKRGQRQLPFANSFLTGENVAITLDKQGRLLVLGPTQHGSRVERLKQDGSLDRRFGHNGAAVIDPTRGASLALTHQGDILVAGTQIIRLGHDGGLERRLGAGQGFGSRWQTSCSEIIIDATGNAVVGGYASSSHPPRADLFLERYLLGR